VFSFKKLIMKIHLWLGLTSGLLVFLISISGVIYTFHDEIYHAIHAKNLHVEPEGAVPLPLDSLYAIVQEELGEQHPVTYVNAYKREDLAWRFKAYRYNPEKITYFSWCEFDYVVYVNPYTGKILKTINHKYEFFQLVKMFHWSLWLRTEIGQPVVGWTVVLFLISLISGIIWWWPKKNRFRKALFTIRWRSISYIVYRDFHVVSGIFSLPVVIILALTGMVWAFKWFMTVVYVVANLSLQPQSPQPEPELTEGTVISLPYETIYRNSRMLNPDAWEIFIFSLDGKKNTISTFVKIEPGVYYKSSRETWDALTGRQLNSKSFDNLNPGEKLVSMNYDIHTGAVLGLWGKILVFLGGLVSAALPVTGFIMWVKKRRLAG
jgi:uncharacterized iron-regulated membrane protein